ncbi:MAG: T9SS type A sorting domain-containing protein [Bacteroidetes bacterium]|nr:T9SS type A sorting domain-containing protein [Bacteroidota bacterium]
MRKFTHKNLIFKWISVCMLFLICFGSVAQESILSANDNAAGTGGTVSYSIGQVAFRSVETGSGIVTQGVQQPYEILFMIGIEDEKATSLNCIAYPNPAYEDVRLKIDRLSTGEFSYQLRDVHGKLISEMKIESQETIIPLKELSAGNYLLTLLENHINQTTWKIIKK